MKNIHKISASAVIVSFLVIASSVFAQTTVTMGLSGHAGFSRPIVGTVSAISSPTSFTMSVQASSTTAITNYTVNTANTKVLRSGVAISASSIQINDKIAVMGTVLGTNITAKTIIDGILPQTTGPPGGQKGGRAGSTIGHSFASSTRAFDTNFVRPAALGLVTAIINSTSFNLAERTKTGTTTLTIDINSSTTYREGTTTAEFSNLAVGNLVAVTGTSASTNEILASKIMIMPAMKHVGNFGKGSNSKGFGGHKKGL